MTTTDTSVLSDLSDSGDRSGTDRARAAAGSAEALIVRLKRGEPYALQAGGQGSPWLAPLAELVRLHGLADSLAALLAATHERLAPVATELARAGAAFDPLSWVAADEDCAPAPELLLDPAHSIPGIALTQIAALQALVGLGLDPAQHPPVATAGHSQGEFAVALLAGADPVEVLATARLAGAATTLVARRRGLAGAAMLAVSHVVPERVDALLADVAGADRVVRGLRNGRRSVVLVGPAAQLARVRAHLEAVAATEAVDREAKRTGGAPFAPVFDEVEAAAGFHHPDLAEVVDLVADQAARCGLDAVAAGRLARLALVDPVDWPTRLDAVLDAGPAWILDLGPGLGAVRLSERPAAARGAATIAAGTRAGTRLLTAPGAAPIRPTPWSAHAPRVVTLPDGAVRLETAFSRLTGCSPVLLAGMTPTTVDAPIVAAAANAGFWAELAGGGQVTEEIFTARVAELDTLLDEGRGYQFNALFLDPYLWRLQLGQQRLVQRARAAGAPINAVIVTAGVPELDEAVSLIDDLAEVGIDQTVFKPGTARQIRQVLAIARAVEPRKVIVQIEGGQAGGHHSWEDLDDLLLTTYADLRGASNVVVCVGGGIGTPEAASAYLSGRWALAHGYPEMPVDGVLIGTAAMATLEATTSPQVKQLLVETAGTRAWIGAGQAARGMASGRSQLGADLHEIDNHAARTGRLLDHVAGDAEAVEQHRDEIIEALAGTAKPYFGDLETLTYRGWLERFVELTHGPDGWLDPSFRLRFHRLVQHSEARLHARDRGAVPTLFAEPVDVDDPAAALGALVAAYPEAEAVRLHPGDLAAFLQVCRLPGKPVTFVPVIDAEVRRWWRSDSLWQAHDARYPADAVSVIPGPVSVAGITRADEPVADLLRRFEDTTIDDLLAAGRAAGAVAGLRRHDSANDAAGEMLALALAAPEVVWAGRTVTNPLRRLTGAWVVTAPDHAEHPATGATLTVRDRTATLSVPLDAARSLDLDLSVPADVSTGAAPRISTASAAAAMRSLVTGAAGGALPPVVDGVARATVAWHPDLGADHAGVTTWPQAGVEGGALAVPDALVGLLWPAVFAVIATTRTTDVASPAGIPVIEGMLDLVHLDHAISVEGDWASAATDLEIAARCTEVTDTEVGRVIAVEVEVAAPTGELLARATERFAVRGRVGAARLVDPVRAGGAVVDERPATRRTRAQVRLNAPADLAGFAAVTGDHNPIHTSVAAAELAGLGSPIVHGMWVSAVAQRAVGRPVEGWTIRYLGPVRPGAEVDIRVERVGLQAGAEAIEVTVRSDGELVAAATGLVAAPRTAYVFPGQGIQHRGMGMDGYRRSPAAREVWDRADAHTRAVLGFSILTVVRDNPTTLVAQGVTHRHPDGVLYLTQFTQVAMAVLGSAQTAELREAGAFVDGAVLAGHSVGEYNALAAVSGVIPLEAVVEVVFQRGSVMHTLVPRDADGRSDYRLAAIRPSQIGLDDATVGAYVDRIAAESGEFLQIVNLNLRDSQYALAGTVRGLKVLEDDVARRREEFGGRGAFVYVPGIDVPFHSRVLHGGVNDFRDRLTELLPTEIDPQVLIGRYVPNLVPRPFTLDPAYVREVADLVDSAPLQAVLADLAAWTARPGELCRILLIELLAWQFASPVRWIETQDLLFTPVAEGGLGVERLVEVGVGQSPTIANLAASTLTLPGGRGGAVEVVNVERDAPRVFATDTDPVVEDDEPIAEAAETAEVAPEAALTPAAASRPSSAEPPADLEFGADDATTVLVAWWTKVRPDQMGAADSIETLCDGASSRRNQVLVDLGAELALGAIDGAAEADFATLGTQVRGLARGYRAFGPVLSVTLGDHLKKVLGPVGRKQASIVERVTGVWGLGPGWASHVVAAFALATRDGASVRGGDLGDLAVGSVVEFEAAVDSVITQIAAARGVVIAPPGSGDAAGGTVDLAALEGLTAHIAGPDGALAAAARTVLQRLGLEEAPAVAAGPDADDERVLARVAAELGSEWVTRVAPAFDARRAVLLDDRWASAREDLARIALGESVVGSFVATGEIVARQAEFWIDRLEADGSGTSEVLARLRRIAVDARSTEPGRYQADTAVVTGAGRGSIALAIVGDLLAGGATVVATCSRLSSERLREFAEAYRAHARGGARLWVVPANLASFADVDALAAWITAERSTTVGATTTIDKPAMTPTLLFPFAAGSVSGDLAEAGSSAEIDLRLLVWSVERLIGALALDGRDHDLAARLHVVLPGSPNRGTFGGDGAYGEAKAALDAIVAKWRVERRWADRVTLVHALIGWVRGTGLMGGNDPLVEAVEAAGISTWSTADMAAALLAQVTPEVREACAEAPVTVDLTGGLLGAELDLRGLAAEVQSAGSAPEAADSEASPTISAVAPSPYAPVRTTSVDWAPLETRPEDLVVVVGAGELGPWGSARTRGEVEVTGELSAAGVLELAWTTGLVRWENGTGANAGWVDVASGESVAEADLVERYHDAVVEACGIRTFGDEGTIRGGTVPLLASVFLEQDLTFTVGSRAEAEAMRAADVERTRVAPLDPSDPTGEWRVTRLAGTEIRVPRRVDLTRTVGGQIPTGFDPTAWGVPTEMLGALDRVAVWNLVCTVDAFLSSGFSPAELMRWVHPAEVANTQGTGMGGMTSMQSLYLDTLLGEPTANDLLQEALPNVIAAHVVQSYVGSYGAMIHPVAACATTAVSVEEGVDKIRLGKAAFVVAGGFDDLGAEGVIGFAAMSATADTEAMRARGIDDRHLSRANDRRRGGFVESQGGGTILLARGDVALAAGLPVLAVVAYAGSFADGVHTSIPAPGLGALAAGRGGAHSPLARGLASLGLTHDDIAVVSKHDTSTAANDPNESDLHERLGAALGRSTGNPLFVISQKSLTGHAKGGAAAFQLVGLCQVLESGVLPPNRSLDCVDEVLAEHEHLVWLRRPLRVGPVRAAVLTSLGFGHVAGLVALAHPAAFLATLTPEQRAAYEPAAEGRRTAGRVALTRAIYGGEAPYRRPADRRFEAGSVRTDEAALLLDPSARLGADGHFARQAR